MSRLAPVLTQADLPLAELHAARLDGELVALDGGFTAVDQPHDRTTRAISLLRFRPDRLIAERWTAAWVWGAIPFAPAPHTMCASLGARARTTDARQLAVREVMIDSDEVALVAGVRVTTPLRTITDLARFDPDAASGAIAALARSYSVSVDDCRQAMERRRNLPNKIAALERVVAALNPS